MVGLTEVAAGLSGLKTAMDVVKGLNATAGSVAINDAKIELQSAIIEAQSGLLAAQEAQAANLRRIDQLEQEIVQLKDWSAERERYEPVDIYRGSIAYMPKEGVEEGQPPHWLCANCFEQRRKSFLQFKGQDRTPTGGRGLECVYACNACMGTVKVDYRTKPAYREPPQ